MLKKALLLLCVILIAASALRGVQALSFELTLNVKEKYDLGEAISVCGNLTLGGSPVSDGLVTLQVDDPKNNSLVLRSLNTGSTPSGPWTVEILEFITCDSNGNPKSNFQQNGALGIKINVKNKAVNTQHVIVSVNFYSGLEPYMVLELLNIDMGPETNETHTIWPIHIPYDAKLGQAFAYANAMNEWPKNGGIALSLEKSATFYIGSGGGGQGTYSTQYVQDAGSPGEFNLTFRTISHGGLTGNYTVWAVSLYEFWYATNQTTFEVYLLGDVNGDGKVRVDDVLAVALAFGKNEGDPGWDPRLDLTNDGKIRVDDILIVAMAFGKYSGQ